MKKKKIKLCFTKQLLNMFKLWCEWGISQSVSGSISLLVGRRETQTKKRQKMKSQLISILTLDTLDQCVYSPHCFLYIS